MGLFYASLSIKLYRLGRGFFGSFSVVVCVRLGLKVGRMDLDMIPETKR
jgi:hypothetical protein